MVTLKKNRLILRKTKKKIYGGSPPTEGLPWFGKKIYVTGQVEEDVGTEAPDTQYKDIVFKKFKDRYTEHRNFFEEVSEAVINTEIKNIRFAFHHLPIGGSDDDDIKTHISQVIPRLRHFDDFGKTNKVSFNYLNTHGDSSQIPRIKIPHNMMICYFNPINQSIHTTTSQYKYFKDLAEKKLHFKIRQIYNYRSLLNDLDGAYIGDIDDNISFMNYGCFENSIWYYPGQYVINNHFTFNDVDYKRSKMFRFFYNFSFLADKGKKDSIETYEIKKSFYYQAGYEALDEKNISFHLQDYFNILEDFNKINGVEKSIIFIKACRNANNMKIELELNVECLICNLNYCIEKAYYEEGSQDLKLKLFQEIRCGMGSFFLSKIENSSSVVDYQNYDGYSRKIPILMKIIKKMKEKRKLRYEDISFLYCLGIRKLKKFIRKINREFSKKQIGQLEKSLLQNDFILLNATKIYESFLSNIKHGRKKTFLLQQSFLDMAELQVTKLNPELLEEGSEVIFDSGTKFEEEDTVMRLLISKNFIIKRLYLRKYTVKPESIRELIRKNSENLEELYINSRIPITFFFSNQQIYSSVHTTESLAKKTPDQRIYPKLHSLWGSVSRITELPVIESVLPNINSLVISDLKETKFNYSFKMNKNLMNLEISDSDTLVQVNIENNNFRSIIFRNLPFLRHIYLNMYHLENLELHDLPEKSYFHFTNVPGLKEIKITNCKSSFLKEAHKLKMLETLSISECELNKKHIIQLFESTNKIKKLEINNCIPQGSSFPIEDLLKASKIGTLRQLKLTGFPLKDLSDTTSASLKKFKIHEKLEIIIDRVEKYENLDFARNMELLSILSIFSGESAI
jgi:hypothetical protein